MRKLLSLLFLMMATAMLCIAQVTTVPVDPLTGRLALTLPITELHSGSLSVPVVLVYTAGGGVQVHAEESSAGVGFDVAASGAVRRELRALPDDYKGTSGDTRLGWLNGTTSASIQAFAPLSDNDLTACIDERDDFNFVNALNDNLDPEADLFSVSAPGLSGRFMFDAGGIPRPIPYQDIKINATKDSQGKITAFNITTNTGVNYAFTVPETASIETTTPNTTVSYLTSGYGYYQQILNYTSAWNLSKITAPDGSVVEYSYLLPYEKGKKRTTAVVMPDGTMREQYTTVNISYPHELESVRTKLNRLSFNWVDHRIESLVLNNDQGNAIGIKYSFTYRNYRDKWKAPPAGTRAFLTTVKQESNCISYPAYTFRYQGLDDTDNTVTLPFESEGRTDLWGYCNGTSAGSVPAVYVNTSLSDGERLRVIPMANESATLEGDDRAVNADYVASGMLSVVLYPTGSSTYIQYEPNAYFDAAANKTVQGGGVRVKRVQFESTKTEYYYNTTGNANAGDATSGKLSYPPTYAFADGEKIIRTTAPMGPESYVLYSRAVVRQSGRGRTVYDYALPAMYPLNIDQDWSATKSRVARFVAVISDPPCTDIGNQVNGYYTYPFAPATNFEFERGLPLSITDYAETGAKVQERSYTYQRLTPGTKIIKGIRLERLANNIVYGLYTTIVNTGKVVKTETVKRADEINPGSNAANPVNLLEATTTYAYNTGHQMLQSASMTNSDGVSHVTQFRYAKDFASLTDPNTDKPEAVGVQQLNATNRHGTLLETQTFTGQLLTGASITLYKKLDDGRVLPSLQASYPHGDGFKPMTVQTDATGKQEIAFGQKYLSTFQSYSAVGNVASAKDYRQKRAGTLYDAKGELPYAVVSNALAEEVAYDGFEDASPFFTLTNATRKTTSAWAGGWGTSITSLGKLVRDNLAKGAKRYRAACWVNAGTATSITFKAYSGTTTYATAVLAYSASSAKKWKYIEAVIDVSGAPATFSLEVTSSATANIDEVRFYPLDAQMTTFAYNVLKGKTAAVGERGEAVFTNYDDLNRVVTVLDQNKDLRVLKEYNFATTTNLPALVGGLSPRDGTVLEINKSVTFSAPANCLPVGYTWKINGVEQALTAQSISYTPTEEGQVTVAVTVSYPTLDPITTEVMYCVGPPPLIGFAVTVQNIGPGANEPTEYSNCVNNNKKFTATPPSGGCDNRVFTYEWSYQKGLKGAYISLPGSGPSITFKEELGMSYHMSCTVRQYCDCAELSDTKGKIIKYISNDPKCE